MPRKLIIPLVSDHNTLALIAGRCGIDYQWAMETQSWLDVGVTLFRSLLFKKMALLETRTRQSPFESSCREFVQLEMASGHTIAWVGVVVKAGQETAMMLFIEDSLSSAQFTHCLCCANLGNTPQDKNILKAYFHLDTRYISHQEKLIVWYLILQSPTALNIKDLMEERLRFLEKYQREPLRYVMSQFVACYQHAHFGDIDKALCMSSIHRLLRRFEQKKSIELDVNHMPELHLLRFASNWDKQLQSRAPQYELYYIWIGAISVLLIILGIGMMGVALLFWFSAYDITPLLLLFLGACMILLGGWALGLSLESDVRLVGYRKPNLMTHLPEISASS